MIYDIMKITGWRRVVLVVLALALPCLGRAADGVEGQLEVAHRRLVEEFLRPEGLLCDYVGEIPTPKDCAEGRPNAIGWWSPIENGPMFTGPYLAACVERARRLRGTPEGERAKAECAKMASGLIRAASVSDVTGMIVRGFGTDGKCHYPLGSTDQTLPWFYGLHAYWRSELPSSAEKTAIRAKMLEVAGALERNGWQCPCDGRFKGENRGSFRTEGKLYFRVATHGLYLFAAMYEVSGDAHWRDLYVRFRDGRIKNSELTGAAACEAGWCHDAKAFPAEGDGMWIYVCAQGCLKDLVRMEPDAVVQARYRRGLVYNAERARRFLAKAKAYDNRTERPFKYANWRTGYAWRDQLTQTAAGQVAGSGNRKILGTRKGYERGHVTTPLSAAAVCAFAGIGQEDVANAIAHYDFREISICEFFLAEVAWYAFPGEVK